MNRIWKYLCVFVAFLAFASVAQAQTTLVTVVTDDANPQDTWWPYRHIPAMDISFRTALARYGIYTIDHATRPEVRFSAVAYQAGPLTPNNAKNLAGLFGANLVINGKIHWSCVAMSAYETHCNADANLLILATKGSDPGAVKISLGGAGQTESAAKEAVLRRIAGELAFKLAKTSPQGSDEIPSYINKPVLVIDALPNADMLVALRKTLKQIPGVNDVAERWVSQGSLALEINPASDVMSFPEFERIVNELIRIKNDQFIVRETRRSPSGIGIEVVNF